MVSYLNLVGDYMNLSQEDHTDPGITERDESHACFAFGGWGAVTAPPPVSTVATSFQGWIDHCVNLLMGNCYDCTPGPTVIHARCESRNHQLIWRGDDAATLARHRADWMDCSSGVPRRPTSLTINARLSSRLLGVGFHDQVADVGSRKARSRVARRSLLVSEQ